MKIYRNSECNCEFEIDLIQVEKRGKPLDYYIQNQLVPPIKLDINNINLDCPLVWKLLARGQTKGVFQLESNLGKKWTKKLKPTSIEHLSALGALLRPGCLRAIDENGISMTEHYCLRKNNLEKVDYYHPALEPILSTTYGVLTYQEQAMAIAQAVACFNLQEADVLRKCITKETRFISKTRGWISLDTLMKTGYQDELFLIMDENGNQQWKKIEKIWSTGKHDVTLVESQSGINIWATKYHQFLTNNGWKARSRLKETDFLVTARNIEYDGTDKISQNMAIIIAGLLTEGHFIEERMATFVNHDKDFMQTFIDAFNKEFGFYPTMSEDKKVARIPKEQKIIINKIMNYGLSKDKFIPEIMMGMTKETTRQFLSYILGAEGGVTESNGQFEFSSKSKEFIYQVKLLLLRFGIRSYIAEKNVKDYGIYYRLYINDVVDQEKLYNNLCSLWSKYKVESLYKVFSNKQTGYTTDIFPQNITEKMLNQYPHAPNKQDSGTLYTSNISRSRFAEVANNTKDDYWINLAKSNHCYDKLKTPLLNRRQIETYDFTIEGDNTPYIIADGAVIHNSIGKKLPEEMAKCKKMFTEGADKAKILTKEEAEEVFSWIEKSQRYSFNKSHALSYAINGYWSAFCKAHFPVQFFTSYLYYAKDKADPLQEIQDLVGDAKLMDIEVVTPDISKLRTHFSTDGKTIMFGLSDVKGIGEIQVEKLKKAAIQAEATYGKKLEELSWYEFLVLVSNKISSSVIEKLITVGAMRCFTNVNIEKRNADGVQSLEQIDREGTEMDRGILQEV